MMLPPLDTTTLNPKPQTLFNLFRLLAQRVSARCLRTLFEASRFGPPNRIQTIPFKVIPGAPTTVGALLGTPVIFRVIFWGPYSQGVYLKRMPHYLYTISPKHPQASFQQLYCCVSITKIWNKANSPLRNCQYKGSKTKKPLAVENKKHSRKPLYRKSCQTTHPALIGNPALLHSPFFGGRSCPTAPGVISENILHPEHPVNHHT